MDYFAYLRLTGKEDTKENWISFAVESGMSEEEATRQARYLFAE